MAKKMANKTWLMLLCVLVVISGILTACQQQKIKNEDIKIGSILPLTGDASSIGENSQQAIELAVEEINSKGGINGKRLKVIFEDGMCNPKESANAANKLVNIDKVPVIIGGICSSETLAAVPIAENAKIVLLSPGSSSPDITDAGDYVFRDYPSDLFQGKRAAEVAYNELGARKVALLSCLSDWCAGLGDVFKKRFIELGGEIVTEESYQQSSRDLRSQLIKIKEAKPDLIYFLAYTEASIVGLKQIRELGIDAKLLGGDAWADPKIVEELGDTAEGIMYLESFSPLTEEFKSAMNEKTGGEDITICSPQAYDAVHIIADIMKRVGTDSAKIKDELYNVKDYKGVSGTISFDENGDLSTASYLVKIIKDGKAVPYKIE